VKKFGKLVLRSSNIQNGQLCYENNVFVDIEIPEKLVLKENDILICVRNGSRDLIGKSSLIKGKAIGETFGAFMSVYRSDYNTFISLVFQSDIIKKQIDEHLGATINQITNKSLNSFIVPFPPLNEQTKIATILSDMDAEITALEAKLEKYRQLKQGMMQNLLTGKIRLV
jgi:type I restriction enzyme S subunit